MLLKIVTSRKYMLQCLYIAIYIIWMYLKYVSPNCMPLELKKSKQKKLCLYYYDMRQEESNICNTAMQWCDILLVKY
jgi:hypothetical protein